MGEAESYDYCAIYVGRTNRAALADLVARLFGASVDDQYDVQAGDLLFCVRENEDSGLYDDFIGWPIKVDVDCDPPSPVIVEAVACVLTAAWERGYHAVAAADFEDCLPDLGGLPRYRTQFSIQDPHQPQTRRRPRWWSFRLPARQESERCLKGSGP